MMMRVQLKVIMILSLAFSTSAFASTSYLCHQLIHGKLDPNDVIEYRVDFNHGFFSENTVSFTEHNTAGNWDAPIIKKAKIGAHPKEVPGPNDPNDYEGNDYSHQSFLLISRSVGSPSVFGKLDNVYISDALVRKQSSGLALYEHEEGDFGGYNDHEFMILSCEQAQ